jgi:pimeloyl-ACP methyl ester carboxylesterase
VIVWGAMDEFAPVGGAHRFQKQFPDANLVVLDEAGHFLMEDDPERVASEVRSFLESIHSP